MVGVENSENVTKTLLELRDVYNIIPKLIACDFSPNIVGPICNVYGEEKLQIDGFHVMQELNRGIRSELIQYRNKTFRNEVRDLEKLRNWITSIQKEFKSSGEFKFNLEEIKNSININFLSIKSCLYLINEMILVFKNDTTNDFLIKIQNFINSLNKSLDPIFKAYSMWIKKLLPKKEISNKRQLKIQFQLLSRIKKIFLNYRSNLEENSKNFYKNYWVLFIQPEKMTNEREKVLEEFLSSYPELREFRQMTLSIGEIYRQTIKEIDGHQIDELKIKSNYSDKLKSAIKTLKKFKNSIIRFSTTFKHNSKLAKISHVSMEYINKKFKAPFMKGYNRCNINTIQRRLSLQMNCKVEFCM